MGLYKITIQNFISGYDSGDGDGSGDGYGDGSGYGSGNGSGSGNGDGSGDGSGNGSGYGSGNGSGNGDGNGYGDGSGYGSGNGNGNGTGNGDGSGIGSGYGSGYDSGYGSGNGDGSGYGSGNGLGDGVIKRLMGNDVYYIDNIPCIFESIKNNYAKVHIIDKKTFQIDNKSYLARYHNCLAHGDKLKSALNAAEAKFYLHNNFDALKTILRNEFSKGKLTGKELFRWHNYLTGSCEYGRNMFVKQHNIDLNKRYSLKEFVDICGNDYGGDKIKELLD